MNDLSRDRRRFLLAAHALLAAVALGCTGGHPWDDADGGGDSCGVGGGGVGGGGVGGGGVGGGGVGGGGGLGISCTQPTDCAAGQSCVDSVCCNQACNGACEACNLPGSPGICSPIPPTLDPDEPELSFLDANCDGIDGVEANAIFVDALGGNDAFPGSRLQPKLTIGAGIVAAASTKDVYVSKGVYSEAVTLVDGVSLYGGYDASAGWSRAVGNLTTILSPSSVGVQGSTLATATAVQLFTINASNATGTSTAGDGRSSYGVLITSSPGGVTLTALTISAGAGSAGLAGANGTFGANGGTGTNASGTIQGGPGASPCGATGGQGAAGVSGPNAGNTGGTGFQVIGGGTAATGGAAGTAGSCSGFSSTNGGSAPAVAQNGGPGSGGVGGLAGAPIGALNASGLYLPMMGGGGAAGAAGGPGGGGGSGGGTASGTNLFCTNCSALSSGG
ncbi:MAG: RNA-binding protein, partial [Myxococcaceae bacterium]|nr:RNA-binding protein [Myxococcaceae bacterium]